MTPARRSAGAVANALSAAIAHETDFFGPQPTSSVGLPSAEVTARLIITGLLGALDGRRRLGQIARLLDAPVLESMQRRVALAARLRQAAHGTAATVPSVVMKVHVCEPVDGVAEVAATARVGRSVKVFALRLESIDHRWVTTVCQIG